MSGTIEMGLVRSSAYADMSISAKADARLIRRPRVGEWPPRPDGGRIMRNLCTGEARLALISTRKRGKRIMTDCPKAIKDLAARFGD
jgi:hypothetical protein